MRGLEPLTPCMPCKCSSQMSYTPIDAAECSKNYLGLSTPRIYSSKNLTEKEAVHYVKISVLEAALK